MPLPESTIWMISQMHLRQSEAAPKASSTHCKTGVPSAWKAKKIKLVDESQGIEKTPILYNLGVNKISSKLEIWNTHWSYKIKSRSAACKQSSFQLLRAIGILQEFFKNSGRKSSVIFFFRNSSRIPMGKSSVRTSHSATALTISSTQCKQSSFQLLRAIGIL